MSSQLLEILNGVKTMSIVGMCKNAGKTTMLNWMLHHDRLRGTLGLTSIGRDGESTDVVTGTEKPGIFVRDMLRLGDVTTEILATTGIPTPLGEVVILRARSAGNVQLAGPSITSQLREVSRMFFELGADKSIIDGALGRKSLGARAVAEGVVLCTGASYHMSMEKVVADTANIYRIMNLPKAETLPPEAEEGLEKCLKEEMGVEPSRKIRELFQRVFHVKEHMKAVGGPADLPFVGRKKELFSVRSARLYNIIRTWCRSIWAAWLVIVIISSPP